MAIAKNHNHNKNNNHKNPRSDRNKNNHHHKSNISNSHRPKQQLQQPKQTSSFTAKSTDATVFVKFTPASAHVTRQVLERWFGEIGPIRKCAVIRESQRSKTTPTTAPPSSSTDDFGNKGYGFVKFVSAQDAELAVQQLHGKTQPLAVGASGGSGHYSNSSRQLAETLQVRLVVDLATATPKSDATKKNETTTTTTQSKPKSHQSLSAAGAAPAAATKPKAPRESPRTQVQPQRQQVPPKSERPAPLSQTSKPRAIPTEEATTSRATAPAASTTTKDADNDNEDDLFMKKKKNRVIIRNLSFYAQEQHVRKELEERFGKIVDVHVPRVEEKEKEKSDAASHHKKKGIHRGFCFVTFDTTASAQQAVEAAAAAGGDTSVEEKTGPILIHNRPVRIEWSVSKHVHEERTQQQKQAEKPSGDKRNARVDAHQEEEEEADKMEHENDDEEDNDDDDDDDEDDDPSEQDEEENDDDDDDDDSDDNEDQTSEDEENDDDADESLDNEDEDKKQDAEKKKKDSTFGDVGDQADPAVTKHCCVFVRNLPFDATRHDLFEVFRSFGRITSIYLVKDRETGAPKGTAFVTFEDASYAQRALEKSGDDTPTATSIVTPAAGDKGLFLQGRRLVVHLAVDRDTASTLAMDKSTSLSTGNHALRGKDRRNLYLQTAGRVNRNDGESTKKSANDGNTWDDLPESDQQKRQRAFADTSTKLKSPLFFINPNRLSIRNVAKHVDETDLKRLCVEATKKGLARNLVSIEDQAAHWRAQGDLTPRDILQRLQDNTPGNAVIPEFNEKNVKQFIPSVFIDRDFDGSAKASGMSRGFGFVEFQHHIHALACLRELNNNTAYTEEYVAGGKKAIMGAKNQKKRLSKRKKADGEVEAVKIPRLIVEFTVENKAKAKQQIAHRAQQQANYEKQKRKPLEPGEGADAASKQSKTRKSRGAKQREKKRRLGRDEVEQVAGATMGNDDLNNSNSSRERKDHESNEAVHEEEALVGALGDQRRKGVTPPKKKRKVDKEEANFDKMVNSYRTAFAEVAEKGESEKRKEKRWFEEVA